MLTKLFQFCYCSVEDNCDPEEGLMIKLKLFKITGTRSVLRHNISILLVHLLQTAEEEETLNKKRSKKIQKKIDERKKTSKVNPLLEEQFQQGKLLGKSNVYKVILTSLLVQPHSGNN